MKTTRMAVLAMVMALGGSYTSEIVSASTEHTAPTTATRKGVIKKIDDTTIVIWPADNKKSVATYDLTADTKREGSLGVGEEVVISYYYSAGKAIVTLVKAAK